MSHSILLSVGPCEAKALPVGRIGRVDLNLIEIAMSAPMKWKELEIQGPLDFARKMVETLEKAFGLRNIVKLAEDVAIFLYQMSGASSRTDVAVAIGTFVKLQTGESLLWQLGIHALLTAYVEIFETWSDDEDQVQGANFGLASMRQVLDNFKSCLNSAVVKRVKKMVLACVSTGLLDKLGIDPKKLGYSDFEAQYAKRSVPNGVDFGYIILDTIVFILERANVAAVTGSVMAFFHSGDKYEEWGRECLELKRLSKLLNDPKSHGFSEPEFYQRLDNALETGRQMVRLSSCFEGVEKKACNYQLNDLLLLRDELLVRKAAREPRKSPFAILYNGSTSIGKSSLIEITFKYLANLLDLPSDPSYKYTKNGFAEFWDGFKSSQWCVVIDDIAFMHPNVASGSGGDPSVMEVIQINNSVNYVPNQAALEDKGKIPLKNRVTIATTNTPHLNAQYYYSHPVAVMRRFPTVVHIKPKKRYRSGKMLDSTLVHAAVANGEDPYDLWTFMVEKAVGVTEVQGKEQVRYEKLEFNTLNDYLAWLGREIIAYEASQQRVVDSLIDMPMHPCKTCYRIKDCECAEAVQTSDVAESDESETKEEAGSSDSDSEAEIHIPLLRPSRNGGMERIPEETRNIMRSQVLRSREIFREAKRAQRRRALSTERRLSELRERNRKNSEDFIFGQRSAEEVYAQFMEEEEFAQQSFVRTCNWISDWFWDGVSILQGYWLTGILMGFAWCSGPMPLLAKWMLHILWFAWTPKLTEHPIFWRVIGNSVIRRITRPHWVVPAIAGLTAVLAGYYCVSRLRRSYAVEEEEVQSVKVGKKPQKTAEDEKRENVWYKEDFRLSTLDLSPQITSSAGMSDNDFLNKMGKHIIHGRFTRRIGEDDVTRVARMVAVGGQVLMTNNHCIPTDDDMVLRLTLEPQMSQVGSNFKVDVFESEVLRFPERDLAFIRIRPLKLYANIDHLFAGVQYGGRFDGTFVQRTVEGEIESREVKALQYTEFTTPQLGIDKVRALRGYVQQPTAEGDCGSLYIQHTPSGHVLVGIHVAGNGSSVVALAVEREIVSRALQHFDKYQIQAGRVLMEDSIVSLHPKCPLRFIESGVMDVYGSLPHYHTSRGSSVVPTVIQKSLVNQGMEVRHGAPVMSGWLPKRLAYQDLVDPQTTGIDYELLDGCVADYVDKVWSQLTEESKKMIHVVDTQTALNGAEGIPFMERMNMSSSAGYPYRKPKRLLLEGEIEKFLPEEVEKRVDQAIEDGLQGISTDFVYDGSLKDEPTPFKKIEESNTRVFNVGNIEAMTIGRQLFMGFMRCIMSNRTAFEMAVGLNCQSAEWEEVYNYLHELVGRHMAGDYKKYDKRLPSPFMIAVVDVFVKLAELAGWRESEIKLLRSYGMSVVFPLVNMFGDIVRFLKSLPSGAAVTTIFDCIANSLNYRYGFEMAYRRRGISDLGGTALPLFRKVVRLITLGDDNAAQVDERVSWFNHVSLAAEMAVIGIKYTMAEKDAELVPFVDFDKVTFLKRTWKFDKRFNSYSAPLEWKSIEKMLLVCVKSKSISGEEHAVAVISAALREAYQHGDKEYDELRSKLEKAIRECSLEPYVTGSTLPSKEQLLSDWKRCSKNALIRLGKAEADVVQGNCTRSPAELVVAVDDSESSSESESEDGWGPPQIEGPESNWNAQDPPVDNRLLDGLAPSYPDEPPVIPALRAWDLVHPFSYHYYSRDRPMEHLDMMCLMWAFGCVCDWCVRLNGLPLRSLYCCGAEGCYICDSVFDETHYCQAGYVRGEVVHDLDTEAVTALVVGLRPIVMRGLRVEDLPWRSQESVFTEGLADPHDEYPESPP